jgi:hypothetical protein
MITDAEYRQYAEECLKWARAAKTAEEREAFLKMAHAWTQVRATMNGKADPVSMTPPTK